MFTPDPLFTRDEYDAGMRQLIEMLERNNPRERVDVRELADRLADYEAVHYPLPLGPLETKGHCGPGATTTCHLCRFLGR